jgi:hypothetical protein
LPYNMVVVAAKIYAESLDVDPENIMNLHANAA